MGSAPNCDGNGNRKRVSWQQVVFKLWPKRQIKKTFTINKGTKTFLKIQNFVLHAGDYDFANKVMLSIRGVKQDVSIYLYWSSGTLVILLEDKFE